MRAVGARVEYGHDLFATVEPRGPCSRGLGQRRTLAERGRLRDILLDGDHQIVLGERRESGRRGLDRHERNRLEAVERPVGCSREPHGHALLCGADASALRRHLGRDTKPAFRLERPLQLEPHDHANAAASSGLLGQRFGNRTRASGGTGRHRRKRRHQQHETNPAAKSRQISPETATGRVSTSIHSNSDG